VLVDAARVTGVTLAIGGRAGALYRPHPNGVAPVPDRMSDTAVRRHDALVSALPDDLDAVLVTRPENVRYLTGFGGSNGAVLVGRGAEPVLATDGRYVGRAASEAPGVEIVEASRPAVSLVDRAAAAGVGRLGFESHHVTVDALGVLQDAAGERLALVAVGKPVEALRVVKDDGEVAALRRACELTDAAFGEVVRTLRAGITEQELAWTLAGLLRGLGAEGPSFPSIVAFGPHAAIPHHHPTDRPLGKGDLVKLDFGALLGGYHADLTRTAVMGPPADWQCEIYEGVRTMQAELLDDARPGAVPAELDADMRRRIDALGHRPAHGLGHGVGLEIHEDPFLTEASAAAPLRPGMVVTIEPGIYLAGRGGVRIEDTVLIGPDGPERLTTSPRELIEC
jgi:Xaa-Pro aminopeptidase